MAELSAQVVGNCVHLCLGGMECTSTKLSCVKALALFRKFFYDMTQDNKKQLTPVWLRKRAQMTQRQASDLLGVRESTISEWERGLSTPSILLVPKIAQVYGASKEEVVDAFVNIRSGQQEETLNSK